MHKSKIGKCLRCFSPNFESARTLRSVWVGLWPVLLAWTLTASHYS